MKHISLSWNSFCTRVKRYLLPTNAWKRTQSSFSTWLAYLLKTLIACFLVFIPVYLLQWALTVRFTNRESWKKRTEFKLCMYCWIHESLQHRLFPSTLFDQLDLSPCPGEDFYPSGFQDTLLLGDCTENWIPSPENFDIRNATFSIRTMTLAKQEFG